jgi:plastocyanin
MRATITALALVLLVAVLPNGSASAVASHQIAELDFVFTPDPVSVQLGDTVTWKNEVGNPHTSTDQSALLLWDSGRMDEGATFSFTVTAAGTYPYFCQLHEAFGMFGTIRATDFVSPPAGPPGASFTVEVATDVAPAGFVYDIQRRDPGGAFQEWVTTTDPSAVFDSTGHAAGTYLFRSRLHRLSDGASTEYSPAVGIQVTPNNLAHPASR